MSRQTTLEARLAHRLEQGEKAFVPYLTAGLPSPQQFVNLATSMAEFADAIEVGVPFSDPIADGPIIQEASTRALKAGMTLQGCFALIRQTLKHADVPVVVMTYFNPIHRMGVAAFAQALSECGAAGLIVPDLPFEESAELAGALAPRGVALVQMIAPTTPPERAAKIAASSSGYVYAISRLGVTGERDSVAAGAREVVERVKPYTSLPVLIGFGVSNAEQARAATEAADGVIVGSAIMKKVIAGDLAGALALAREIRSALGGSQ
jgi:tryptophan synthase alpha chain